MKNEDIQHLVFTALGGCSWEYDLVTNRTTYSEEFFELLGYGPEGRDIDDDWISDNIHPKDLSQWREAFIKNVKAESRYFDCELRFRHRDDYYIWIQTRGVVTERDADGTARRVVGMVFDIGERKGAKENESRFRLFLDNIPDAISLKGPDHQYFYINRRFEEWLGKPSYEIYGKTAEEIFHPDADTLHMLRAHERRVWEKGETISEEREFPMTPDGRVRHAVITKFPVFDEAGKILAIGTTNTDVTARYQAQEALRLSEQRYRRMFEAAPAVLAETDWTGGKKIIDDLRAQGVEDLRQYLIDRPELMRNRGQILKVKAINREALRVYKAENLGDMIRHMEGEMNEVQRLGMIEDLVNFAGGQRRSNVQSRTLRLDGEDFPIIAETEFYGSDPDDWSRVLLTIRDISVEEELRENEQRYRTLFESAPATLCEIDWSRGKQLIDELKSQGVSDIRQYLLEHPELIQRQDDVMVVSSVNQEAVRIFRADSVERLLDYSRTTVDDAERANLIEELAQLAAGRRRTMLESRHTRLDGEDFPVIRECELLGDDPEDWSRGLLTMRDTSAAEAVRLSEMRYRRLFESAPVALYESDWSRGKLLVDGIREQGVGDLGKYIDDHPEILRRRDEVLSIIDLNREALQTYRADDKQELIAKIEGPLTREQRESLKQTLLTFADGNRRASVRGLSQRADGEMFPVVRNTELISRDRGDWSRVLSSIHDFTEEVETANRLQEYQQELRLLAGKISAAEESERRRISSELHDGTIQNLVLARIHLANLRSSLPSEKGQQLADSINDLLENSLRETRSLIFEISPPVLYELGLEPAVEWLAEHYKQRTGVEVEITSDDGGTRLSQEMNIVMFQCARELLVNIAKHAQAKHVAIDWRHEKDRVILSVRDDGVGFDVDSPAVKKATEGGFGLFAVRERLKLMGARLEIESSPGGSLMTITAPVAAQQKIA